MNGNDDPCPVPDHNTRRAVLLEIAAVYGIFIALALWNWWPA